MPPAKPAEAGPDDKEDANTTVVVKYVDRIEYKEIGNWVCMYCVHVPLCVRCMFLSINVYFISLRVYLTACDVVSFTLAYWQRPLFFSFKFPVSQSPSLSLVMFPFLFSSLALAIYLCLFHTHSCTGWNDRLQGSAGRDYKVRGSRGRSACGEDRHQGGSIWNTAKI